MQVNEQLLNIRLMLLRPVTETHRWEQIGRELKMSSTGGEGKSAMPVPSIVVRWFYCSTSTAA